MSSKVCNMISNIKNSQLVNKTFVIQKRKKICEKILNILWNEGFILGYKIVKKNPSKIKIFLKYRNDTPVINFIKIISKPGLRIYYSLKKIWKFDSNQGVIIISTTQGFMSNTDCKKKKLGGEPFILIK